MRTCLSSSDKKRFDKYKTGYESANVSEKSNPSLGGIGERNKTIHYLKTNPEAKESKGWKFYDTDKVKNGD